MNILETNIDTIMESVFGEDEWSKDELSDDDDDERNSDEEQQLSDDEEQQNNEEQNSDA